MTFWRNKYFIIITAGVLIILAGIIYYYQKEAKISRKPDLTTPNTQTEKQSSKSEERWYIKFTVNRQKSTAYTEASTAPVSASGNEYSFGSVAVHPRYPLQSGGKATTPIIPFGTEIFLKKPINIQGEERKSLIVLDTGDVNYSLWPDHPYWLDIYWGNTNYYNDKEARNFGTRLTDYYWYEPWE